MPQKPKDIALSLIQGNPNNITKKELKKRKNNKQKLQLSADHLTPPNWLNSGAKKEFNRIIDLLSKTKLLTDADATTLAIYCDTLYDYKSYKNQIKKHGMMVNGRVNPFIREKRNAAQLLDKLGNELGLSPSARTSLMVNLPDMEEDEDDEF
ncbi:phage terminase small subunit P27 family [Bombilactobacillus bombi]|uniref:Phage terminase small subunit P27 family n=1 Tax=Bombilactobacillus bombi TaxID=1303590 RepID=A0A417Z650_9LACO|nr:phage terminase small subunit P27 family [Bombilactobacillus bombi]RHW46090.1 phage terminase small subunit P27 family [Bombilactobacillus bombi]